MKNNIRKLSESFQHAFRGLGLCIHGERNFRVHMTAAFYVTVFALLGGADASAAAALCLCFGLTMGAELMNTFRRWAVRTILSSAAAAVVISILVCRLLT